MCLVPWGHLHLLYFLELWKSPWGSVKKKVTLSPTSPWRVPRHTEGRFCPTCAAAALHVNDMGVWGQGGAICSCPGPTAPSGAGQHGQEAGRCHRSPTGAADTPATFSKVLNAHAHISAHCVVWIKLDANLVFWHFLFRCI